MYFYIFNNIIDDLYLFTIMQFIKSVYLFNSIKTRI